jgi:hypothetical protein
MTRAALREDNAFCFRSWLTFSGRKTPSTGASRPSASTRRPSLLVRRVGRISESVLVPTPEGKAMAPLSA